MKKPAPISRVLTLTQPWAQLVVEGRKRVETRSWQTGYRGRILIHAAKGMPGWAVDAARSFGYAADQLPRGAIVGEARLVAINRTEDVRNSLAADEIKAGDYAPGRFAWYLEDPIAYPVPVPVRGALGLWRVTEPVLCG